MPCQQMFAQTIVIIATNSPESPHFRFVFSFVFLVLSLIPISATGSGGESLAPLSPSIATVTRAASNQSHNLQRPRRQREDTLRLGRYGAAATATLPHSLEAKDEKVPAEPSGAPHLGTDILKSSYSFGTVTTGTLAHASEMHTDSPNWHFIPAAKTRHTNYGTANLISILSDAAAHIRTQHKGPKLLLGNISFEHGGDLPWSVSHNSGRDADVAFYSTYEDGSSVNHNHFVRFNRRSHGSLNKKRVHFDTERNWTFVKSLLSSEKAQVQWLFLANPLRRKLLQHAKQSNEDPLLISKAEQVLKQPSDSSPHRDHFHIRLYCSKPQVLHGCVNSGRTWDWVNDFTSELELHKQSLARDLRSGDDAVKLVAITNMRQLNYRPSTKSLLRIIQSADSSEDLQNAAFKLLVSAKGLKLDSLSPLLKHPSPLLRKRVITKLSLSQTKKAAFLLIHQFEEEPRANRDTIRQALRQITNHDLSVPDGEGPAHLRLQKQWKDWYNSNQNDDWEQWIREGFERKGANFQGRMLRNRSIPILIKFTRKGGHLSLNANRILSRVTKGSSSNKQQSYSSWKSWWRKRHKRYGYRSARL